MFFWRMIEGGIGRVEEVVSFCFVEVDAIRTYFLHKLEASDFMF